MTRKTAVIAGASGLIGRRIAEQLLSSGNWDVIGLARRGGDAPGIRWIAVDLADADACRRQLAAVTSVTHIFHAARYDHPEGVTEAVDTNTAMLTNLVSTLEATCPLEHVHALQGSKYYGHQLGPVVLPMVENGPRAPGVNFYFNQEAFLRERSSNSRWTYTTSRPHCFCDPSAEFPRSIGLVIAVFAAVQRELGLPFDFPGTVKGFEVKTQFTDLGLLARAITWMSCEPRCANQAFNVVNGDNPQWSGLWPRFASGFGMKPGVPLDIKLVDYMADKGPVWDAVVKRFGLRPTKLHKIALWAYGEYQLWPEWDVRSSMDKARSLGFVECIDSALMFERQFTHYRKEKVTP